MASGDSGSSMEDKWQSSCPSSSGKKQGYDFVSGREKGGEEMELRDTKEGESL